MTESMSWRFAGQVLDEGACKAHDASIEDVEWMSALVHKSGALAAAVDFGSRGRVPEPQHAIALESVAREPQVPWDQLVGAKHRRLWQ